MTGAPSEALGRCGPYALVRRIGAGGMGEIFLARGPNGEEVAIKRLLAECAKDPVFIGMFLDEARLVKRIHHPNVCEVFEHGQEGAHYYLVMEHIDGVSLRDLLEQRAFRGLPFPLAARIMAEVAAGLDHAHRLEDELGVPLGIVHRDVSPANIMIRKDGQVKLVDFGLAKARTQLMKTQPGLVKGKFGYLAPEQLGGRVDWRTDLFALGLCFYEAMTGQQLFGQRTAAETVQAIQGFSGPPPLAAKVSAPAALDALLGKALAPQPDARFQSAAELRGELGKLVREVPAENISAVALAAELKRGVPGKRNPSAPPPALGRKQLDSLELEADLRRSKGVSPVLIAGVAIVVLALAAAVSAVLLL
ncbi:MAG: hypothetical protein SangKO_015450 [Sandaracinaceae bacterium]